LSSIYWDIIASRKYIDQVSELAITTQSEIGKKWTELAHKRDPTKFGKITPCKQGKPYFIIIFPGITFEFVFKLDRRKKEIHLLSCEELTFLKHGQLD